MRAPVQLRHPSLPARNGFTLMEILLTVVILGVVMIALMTVVLTSSRSKISALNSIESVQSARTAVAMMTRDLRAAGYGADRDASPGQPGIAYIDSLEVLINANLAPYPVVSASAPPAAYEPAGNPRPRPLVGTDWTPPMKYRTGAELVRYTLDVNDDGQVDANDIADAVVTEAARTPNPQDYVLVRQVYGDSTGNVAGNNGGDLERIALVNRPGAGVPPMFRVYLQGSNSPWDWSNGPVPAAQLGDIERVEITVAAASSRPDWRKQYNRTVLHSEVNSFRNIPDFGAPEYAVDGYVFDDQNRDRSRDTGEPGIPNVLITLGGHSTFTNATGYFLLRVHAGTYTLRHKPTAGYDNFTSPDSFVVTLPNPTTRSFADIAKSGGWVKMHAFHDLDTGGDYDAGEPAIQGIKYTMLSSGEVAYSDANGEARLFAPTGAYSVAASPPDSLVTTTPNPVSGTMASGDSARFDTGLRITSTGSVSGKVYRDANRNGTFDGIDSGIQGVYVGVTSDGGASFVGYAYTDASGDYTITAPTNDPPKTKPYSIFCIVPSGFYPTTTTSISPLWVQASATVTDQNFGMASFQIITLNASRVLSLSSGDLIEKDWNGNQTQNAHQDADIVLGADAGGTDNISCWFNDYNNSPLFSASPDYTRNAPQSVLSIALDTLDTAAPVSRPDVVTGTKANLAGNFFVWLNQNSGGNEGILPTTYTSGRNYRTNDNGDVSALLSMDCAGGRMPDLIVGTKSPTSGNGTIEIWQSNDTATPSFTRDEVYPNAGGIPGNRMGEVTGMVLADLNNDGRRDLIVGTRTGPYMGEVLVFMNSSKINGSRFLHRASLSIPGEAVTAVAACDVDGDGWKDIVVGTQSGPGTGDLNLWHNGSSVVAWDFTLARTVAAPGLVLALGTADLGGTARQDIAMGWRRDDASYVGGVSIWYTDLGTLPPYGVDPSAGEVVNMVPAVTTNNFNFGVKPSLPTPPYLTDLAAGVKVTSTTGALVVFVR
jgi:prepilin-type N-terminal cleavage/methylation domain-containing protein